MIISDFIEIQLLLWGTVPTLFALAATLVSFYASAKIRTATHFFATGVVILSVWWSLVILYRIFILGAWPTFLPHFAIASASLIAMAQGCHFLVRKQRS